MTQPLDYTTQLPPGRPTSVTVIAILGIIFGGLGTLCSPFALIPYFINFGMPNPIIDAIKQDQALFAWTIFSTVVQWGFSILLLTCSIASLGLKDWARKGMIGWAVASIAMTLVGTILHVLWLHPKMSQLVGAQGPGAQIGGYIGLAFGILFGFGVPLVVLYFYTRPHVVAAFAAPGTSFPAA
jgi:hypothetical protein